ncbi:hypothetical protein [Streptomyces sp. EN16]|uniref:TRADD-N-associated membrane domain-containing protein n=1 Tax=Streptomyces sp. EN16 TaxID=212773 RepID=UPI000A592B3F|nr:hypothetical protein [Streptomyces sp. EN16]
MPPSNQPDPPSGPPTRRWNPKLRVAAIAVLLAVPVLVGVLGDELFRALPSPTSPAAIVAIAGSLSLIGYSIAHFPDRANRAEGESRQRLAQAEFALADALRGTHSFETGTPVPHPRSDGHGDTPSGDASHRRSLLGLPELWEATHARLDLYHQIATGQARTSFRNAQIAMVAGFVLLILFAGIAVWASTTAVAIVAGGLGAVSAGLAGYVAKTFVRSQEAAATHLRSYFDQPLELSRYLAAERLVADGELSQEQRGEILSALVQAMVAGPQPAPAPQSVVVASVPGQQGV